MAGVAVGMLALVSARLSGQTSPVTPSALEEGRKIFAVQCAGCHGVDARGTDQGPPLTGNDRLRGRSTLWLRHVIHYEITSGGMPAFDLPAADLDALAALIHSLNSPAAESFVPGGREAGEQYFFGKGKCASCHMVDGRGSAVGSDLSNVARELTVEGIRRALVEPGARTTPSLAN